MHLRRVDLNIRSHSNRERRISFVLTLVWRSRAVDICLWLQFPPLIVPYHILQQCGRNTIRLIPSHRPPWFPACSISLGHRACAGKPYKTPPATYFWILKNIFARMIGIELLMWSLKEYFELYQREFSYRNRKKNSAQKDS